MTKQKSTKRALLLSALSLLVCVSMFVGSTFAWFTDSVVSGNNKIVAGNLDVVLEYKTDWDNDWATVDENTKIFKEGALYEPGYTEVVYLRVSNAGSLALKYNLMVNVTSEKESTNVYGDKFKLSDYLQIGTYLQDEYSSGANYADILMPIMFGTRESALSNVTLTKLSAANSIVTSNSPVLAGEQTAQVMALVLTMPETVGNEANHKSDVAAPELNLGVSLVATQYTDEYDSFGNQYDKDAEYPVLSTADTWDGTADTSWYNDNDTEFILTTAEQLAGFAELVDGGNTFAGKTVKLGTDIDLYHLADGATEPMSFDPIGDDVAFEGTFDGQGHAIENLYQSGWAFGYEWGSYGSIGLFGKLNNATVKNVTISGAESYVEGGDVGGITGSATGDCVFENITLEDSVFATYNNGNGGIIGWSGAGNYTFKNITIAEDVTLAGLWGSFDSSIGGVVGQGEPGATYNFENVDIACRLDVYNDCTASYDYYNYRMCGMIIGRLQETTTIDGKNYPDTSKYNINCTNVTVTYGEWANYHYCEPTPGHNNGRGMRVEAGYSYGGLPADYDHSQCTTHHNELIPFDQIFGGAQYGVKGLPAYDGVTVIYNN